MARSTPNQFFTYFILITSLSNFTTSFEYFDDDISKVFKGLLTSSRQEEIQFFSYFNKMNPAENQEIIFNDTSTLPNSGLKTNLPTIFIVHGFRSNVSSDMPQTLKNAFLRSNLSVNIIIISWGPISTPLPAEQTAWLYHLVPPNVPKVAKRLAQFVLFLQKNHFIHNLSDVYMIGHSLGSHVSGLAGREIYLETGQKIGRITGLDPAGPLYYPSLPEKNLMKDNALFVDIIHTNAGLLGTLTNDAHADFWPNGGCFQPNCELHDTSSLATLGRCSHQYAYHLYAASITKSIYSCSCKNVGKGKSLPLCHDTCKNRISLGFRCPHSARGVYYASTNNPA